MQDFELSEPNFHPSGWLVQEIELSELIIRPGRHLVQDFELSEPIRARTDSESSKSCPNTTKTRPQPRFRIRKVRNPAPNAQPTRAEATHPYAKRAPMPPARRVVSAMRGSCSGSPSRSALLCRQHGRPAFAMRGDCSEGQRRGLLAGLHRQNEGLVFAMRGGRRGNRSALCLMRRPPRRPAARLARPPTPLGRRACLLWW